MIEYYTLDGTLLDGKPDSGEYLEHNYGEHTSETRTRKHWWSKEVVKTRTEYIDNWVYHAVHLVDYYEFCKESTEMCYDYPRYKGIHYNFSCVCVEDGKLIMKLLKYISIQTPDFVKEEPQDRKSVV